MWLLDANLDVHLVEVLAALGHPSETAEERGLKALRNGELLAAAARADFECLLSRDQLFAESASRTWREFHDFCVVVITIPRMPSKRYLEAFVAEWSVSPIRPQKGRIINWP